MTPSDVEIGVDTPASLADHATAGMRAGLRPPPHAYPGHPDEVQPLWYRALA